MELETVWVVERFIMVPNWRSANRSSCFVGKRSNAVVGKCATGWCRPYERCLTSEVGGVMNRALKSIVLSTLGLALAIGGKTYANDIPPPPYIVTKGDYIIMGVQGDAERMKKLAPKGVRLAPDGTAIVIMYNANDSSGLPSYTSSWLGLEVEGLDAPGGGKGRMMIRGLYGPRPVADALARHFNYPAIEGSTHFQREGLRVTAVGRVGGKDWMKAELVLKPGPCSASGGMAHEVSLAPSGDGIQLIKIPAFGEWCGADSTKFEITAPSSDPLGQLGPVKVLWGGFWRGAFGWSAPELQR